MTFTNTDCVGQEVNWQVTGAMLPFVSWWVSDNMRWQVKRQVEYQILSIRTTIYEEINK
jgi:hypothetical protein